jgi:Gaa1-like, GPI transamidase component
VGSLKHYIHDYHAPPSTMTQFLFRAGEIHIAIHLEIHGKNPNLAILELCTILRAWAGTLRIDWLTLSSQFTICIDGHYGQMSNLDMVLAMAKTLERRDVRVENRFGHRLPERGLNSTMSTLSAAHQITHMLLDQALERQHGPHPAFKFYGIDAMSVFATEARDSLGGNGDIENVAQALDSAFISYNNLRERLHHASWVYIMVSYRAVIYFATFVYIVVIMQGALPIAAYSIWLNSGLSPVELLPGDHDVAKELVERCDFTPKSRDVGGALRVAAVAILYGSLINLISVRKSPQGTWTRY